MQLDLSNTPPFTSSSAAPVVFYSRFATCMGDLLLVKSDQKLIGLYFEDHRHPVAFSQDWRYDESKFAKEKAQIGSYLDGRCESFDLEIQLNGTEFQKSVWQSLLSIRHGETKTYRDIAESIGRPTAVRAVGTAIGKNPISIIVPCHRVVGVDGSLTGYAGGLDRKRRLLEIETQR